MIVNEAFYESGRADLCPPDNSAHISAHNSVTVTNVDGVKNMVRTRKHEAAHLRLLGDYKKAEERARKKGRKLEKRNAVNDHWGYGFAVGAPFAVPVVFVGGMYYAGSPGDCPAGTGAAGGCVAGTCAGAVSGGACAASAGGCGGGAGVSDLLPLSLLLPTHLWTVN